MQRYSFCLIACLLGNVFGAEPNASDKWRQSRGAIPSKDSFRPQPPVVQVENYRYLQAARTSGVKNSAPILESDVDSEKLIVASSGKFDDQSTKTTQSLSGVVSQQSILQWTKSIPQLFDDVDRLIFSTTLPLSAVFAIIPIASTLDLFWVNRLGDALAVAGQAAANQVYNSAFWLFAFLPTITATLVSKSHASGNIEQTQDSVCQAMLFALLLSIPGALMMFFNPSRALSSILKGENKDYNTKERTWKSFKHGAHAVLPKMDHLL